MEQLLSIKDVAARLSVTVRCIYYWRKAGDFPEPVMMGKRCARYKWSEVKDFIDKKH